MTEVIIGTDDGRIDELLHNWRDEGGWHFSAGDPEFWRFSDQLLVPGGQLLDVGSGLGSTSIYFALNGMEVTGIDNDPDRVAAYNDVAAELGAVTLLKMHAEEVDAIEEDFPEGQFDTVIIGAMVHLPSKEAAFRVFDKACAALKPGGHIFVRGATKNSSEYLEMMSMGRYGYNGIYVVDRDVIEHPCTCSGEFRIEPTLFFDPLDLNVYFSNQGFNLVHTQSIEVEGKMNIMYGEDLNPGVPIDVGGMATVIAQKPA